MTDPAATFGELEGRVLTLFGAGDLDGARAAVRLTAERFPDRLGYTAYWRACVESVAGDEDAALEALTSAVERDSEMWWGRELLDEDPDLEPVRSRPGFTELVAECDERRRSEQAVARVEWEIVRPNAQPPASMTLVVLHGRTGNLRDLRDRWGGLAQNVDVVLVQSSQVVAHGMHCWDDLPTAERDVAIVVDAVAGDGGAVVLGGFSQGAGLATRLALKGDPVRARGFLAVAPSFFRAGLTPDDMVALAPEALRAGARGVIFAGAEDDRYRGPAEEVARRLTDAGVPIVSSVVPGMGHDYPRPFVRAVEDALTFVSGEAQSMTPSPSRRPE
jgi:pimeloyl-ACP methyl ester carboxylesterase